MQLLQGNSLHMVLTQSDHRLHQFFMPPILLMIRVPGRFARQPSLALEADPIQTVSTSETNRFINIILMKTAKNQRASNGPTSIEPA